MGDLDWEHEIEDGLVYSHLSLATFLYIGSMISYGEILRKISSVAGGSIEMDAAVTLAEGEERHEKAEVLVLICDRNEDEIMTVCRGGLGR